MSKEIKLALVILLSLVTVASFTFAGRTFTDPQHYSATIETLDEERDTVMKLSAAPAKIVWEDIFFHVKLLTVKLVHSL